MFHALQIVTTIVVSVAMALALAHALELPGKRRLTKEAYYAMQPIYYPGFTIGGRRSQHETQRVSWTALRDRWEYSHVARAVLAMLSFIALVIAISL